MEDVKKKKKVWVKKIEERGGGMSPAQDHLRTGVKKKKTVSGVAVG